MVPAREEGWQKEEEMREFAGDAGAVATKAGQSEYR